MNSSGERELPGDIYLSKLILSRSSKRDHGYYTCLAVNGNGFQYRGAYLTVLTRTPGGKKFCCLVESHTVPGVLFLSLILILNVSGSLVNMAWDILRFIMEDSLEVGMVHVNILNEWLQRANRRWSSVLGFAEFYELSPKASDL
jgi:hypothetical protein